jgi:polygalacturonase
MLCGCQTAKQDVDTPPVSNGFNVRAYGAKGDGKTLDTPAINRAIDAASAAGGGVVKVPAGTYLCYSIHLKSNITFYLDQGAVILAAGTPEKGDYDPPEPNEFDHYQDFGHTHWHNSLIWGEDIHDVTIAGPGLIYGKGLSRGTGTRPTTGPGSAGFGGGFGGGRGFGGGGGGGRGFGTSRPSGTTRTGRRRNGFSGSRPSVVDGNADNQDDRADAPTTQATPDQTYPSTRDSLASGIGNKSISLKNSHNVILRDVSILHGGHFGILVTGVDNLTIDNLKIDTERDGMDIDCCKNVRISNCSVNSPWDDAIVLKSSFGLGTTRACENITIDDCMVTGGLEEGTLLDGTFKKIGKWYTGSNLGTSPPPSTQPTTRDATTRGFGGRPTSRPGGPGRTGRIKFGTESNGGFENIAITNCIFDDCQGLALESVDGAIIQDVTISNLTMRDIVSVPIFIRLGDRARGPNYPPPGIIRRVNISNVVADSLASRFACIITGIPGHPIQDLSISNVRLQYPGGRPAEEATTEPEEREKAYPEPTMFRGMPSWGFFIRHVTGMDMSNVTMDCTTPDERPPFQLEDVHRVNFHDIDAVPDTDTPNFVLKNVSDFRATNVKGMPPTTRDSVEEDKF